MDAEEPGSVAEAVDLAVGEGVVALGAEVPVALGIAEGRVGGERVALGPDRGQREVAHVVEPGQEAAVGGPPPRARGEERVGQDAVLPEQDERGRVEPRRGVPDLARETADGDGGDYRPDEGTIRRQGLPQGDDRLEQGRAPDRSEPALLARGRGLVELEPFQEAGVARCLGDGLPPLPVVERHRAVGPDVGDARDLWRGGQGAQQEGPHRGVVGRVDVAREDRLGDVGQLVAHPLQPGRHGVDHRVQRELGAVTQEAGGVVPRAEIAEHDGRHGREQDEAAEGERQEPGDRQPSPPGRPLILRDRTADHE